MCVKGSGSPGGVAVCAKTVVDVVEARTRIAAMSGARCVMRHTSYVARPSAAPRRFRGRLALDTSRCRKGESRADVLLAPRCTLRAGRAGGGAAAAAAQSGTTTLTLTVTLPDGSIASGARIEVAPPGAGVIRAATITAERSTVVLPLTPGPHRVRVTFAGHRAAEQTYDLAPGTERRLAVRLMPEAGWATRRSRSSAATRRSVDRPRSRVAADLPSGRTVWSPLIPPTRSSRTAWTTAVCGARGPRSAGRAILEPDALQSRWPRRDRSTQRRFAGDLSGSRPVPGGAGRNRPSDRRCGRTGR